MRKLVSCAITLLNGFQRRPYLITGLCRQGGVRSLLVNRKIWMLYLYDTIIQLSRIATYVPGNRKIALFLNDHLGVANWLQ